MITILARATGSPFHVNQRRLEDPLPAIPRDPSAACLWGAAVGPLLHNYTFYSSHAVADVLVTRAISWSRDGELAREHRHDGACWPTRLGPGRGFRYEAQTFV